MIALEQLLDFRPVIDELELAYALGKMTDTQMAQHLAEEKLLRVFAYAHRDYARRHQVKKLNAAAMYQLFFSTLSFEAYMEKVCDCIVRGYMRTVYDVQLDRVWIGQ